MRSERTTAKASAALSADTPTSINGAAELTSSSSGALVVYFAEGADVARVLLQCRETIHSQTAPVTTRLLKGRPYRCAIVLGLGPGTYTVHAVSGLEGVATVEAERVTQLDWRRVLP